MGKDQGEVHVFCGHMASGKSTLAKRIAAEKQGFILCEDDLLQRLYPGDIIDVASYATHSKRIKQALGMHIVELLMRGHQVVLDFPGNTIKQRQWFLSLASQAKSLCTLYVLECSDRECLKRLQGRAAENSQRQSTDTADMFHAMKQYFQLPEAAEGFSRIVRTEQ